MPLGKNVSANISEPYAEYEKRKIAAQRAAEYAELDEQMGRAPAGTARKRMAEYDSIVAEQSTRAAGKSKGK